MPLQAYRPTNRTDEVVALRQLQLLNRRSMLGLLGQCPDAWVRAHALTTPDLFTLAKEPVGVPDRRAGQPGGLFLPAMPVHVTRPAIGANAAQPGRIFITYAGSAFVVTAFTVQKPAKHRSSDRQNTEKTPSQRKSPRVTPRRGSATQPKDVRKPRSRRSRR